VDALFSTNTDKLKELTLKFNSTTAEVGKYSVELDYDYASAGKEMQVTLGSKTQVPNAPNANQNPLLTAGFNVVAPETATILSKAANGIILESNNNTVLFYKTIPVKLNVSLNQGETAFAYKLALDNYTAPNNLINWYIGGALKGSGANMGNSTFAFPFANITQIQGIYYYPPLGQLAILEGKTGGRVSANALVLSPERAEANINTARQGPTALQLQINPDSVTLDNVLAAVKAQTACPAPNTVVWNEAVLIKQ
jgi:hypothetical protein